MKKTLVSLVLLAAASASAQQETLEVTFDLAQYSHPGSWSFSRGCTHTPATGRMNWVHVTAVWLEDMSGNYVTTLHRWGRSYPFDLKAWSVAAGRGIDGVTSATPTSDPAQTMANQLPMVFKAFSTGARDVSKLPDGTYRVRFESSQCELADGWRTPPNPNPFAGGTAFGPTATFMWTKGRMTQSAMSLGANAAPFNNVRVNYTVPAGNAPPGVWAGPDQSRMPSTTPAEATTMLTGRVSDPAGTPTVAWTLAATKPAGLNAMIATPNAATTSVTFTQAGIYTFRLTATDSGGLSSSDDVDVYVNTRLVPSAGDAEVNSNMGTTPMGIIDNGSGPWTWAWGPDTGNRSRAYFRFDLTSVTQMVTFAQLQLRYAEGSFPTTDNHDFFILTDAQDDWNGAANTSTDYEATITWNNQPVTNGLASNLMASQLAGSYAHTDCRHRHGFGDPDYMPGQAATVCPARLDVDLNLANIRTHDANKIWSFFMAPRPAGMNGLGLASDENAVSTQLRVVEFWQSGTNMPPVAVPGTYPPFVDATPPLGTEAVTLNASGSTDDSGIITYEWRENGVLIGSSNSPMFTTTLSLGVHTLELKVIDGGGLSSTATTTVTVDDRFEPNNTRATAALLTAGQYPSLLGATAAPTGDWYAIDLVAGSMLTAAITIAGGNLDVHVYDSAGMLVASGATMAMTETAMLTAGAAGRYFIQVEAVGGMTGAYAMTVTATNALTVTLNPASAVESAGTLMMAGTVTLGAAAAAPVTVNLASSAPAQLNFPAATVMIPMGQTSGGFDVRLVNDPMGVPNTSRYVTITASAAGFNAGSAPFEILDDEAALFVQWDKAGETVSEGAASSLQLRAVLSGTPSGTVMVPFTITGTATRGTDFSTPIMTGSLSISGTTSATYIVNVLNDMAAEGDETVVITMGTASGATASGVTTYTLTITDDDGGGAAGGSGGTAGGGSTGGGMEEPGGCKCSSVEPGLLLAAALLGVLRRQRRRDDQLPP